MDKRFKFERFQKTNDLNQVASVYFIENFSLRSFNTFGIDVKARFYTEVKEEEHLISALEFLSKNNQELFVLGGGSNVLFMGDLDRAVLKIGIGGVELKNEDASAVEVRVGAGVIWHQFVLLAVSKGWEGVENLSLIPGTVGASPIQNIGAYGVEVKDVIECVEAIGIRTGEKRLFSAAECQFGYRDSIFKRGYLNDWIITSVVFRLRKGGPVNTSYGDVRSVLDSMGVENPGISDVSQAVIKIRQSKLPDPAVVGNAGSFFKNPEISPALFASLREKYPAIPGYPFSDRVKVPAGWLIEQTGWKGYRKGSVGVHERQALVLVNYGGATGAELKSLAFEIQNSVEDKFGLLLTPEVNYV